MNKLTLDQSARLFKFFNSKQLGEIAKKNNWIDAKEFQLLTRIARNSTLDEFQKFCVDLEIPSIQLTDQEQEYVKGGGWTIVYGFLLNVYSKFKPPATI